MEIKALSKVVTGVENATVVMNSGDHLSIAYTDPHGKSHTVNITAQHLLLMVVHEPSEAALIFRPAVGVQYQPPKDK